MAAQGRKFSFSLTIEVYDVKTGNMIWQISQAGIAVEKQNKHDFYLFTQLMKGIPEIRRA